MSITRKTEYALRALYEISLSETRKPVTRKFISKRQNVSEHFLERIMIDLLNARITRSVRGPGGGFVLNRNPGDITVWDVYTAVEKKHHFYGKCTVISRETCDLTRSCRIKHVWPEINRAMKDSLSSITLQDIRQNTINRRKTHER